MSPRETPRIREDRIRSLPLRLVITQESNLYSERSAESLFSATHPSLLIPTSSPSPTPSRASQTSAPGTNTHQNAHTASTKGDTPSPPSPHSRTIALTAVAYHPSRSCTRP